MSTRAKRRCSGSSWTGLVVGLVMVLVATGVIVVGLVAASPPASAATVDTGTWYILVNQHSGKALDVAGKGTKTDDEAKVTHTTDGAKATQWVRDETASQQWKFVDSGNGYYRLRNRHSSKVLDVPAFSTSDGTALDQWSDTNGANQQFRLADSAGGSLRLINRNSGKAVSGLASDTADGAQIVQSTDLGGAGQQWLLVPANTMDTGAWYALVNQHSGKALDVVHDPDENDDTDEDKLDGRKLMQWTREDRLTQQWQLVDSGGGYYRLRNRKSDKVLDVPAFSTTDGTVLDQWRDTNGTNVQFELKLSAGGSARLINRNSGKAVSVSGSSTADGAEVVQWTDLNGASQQWRLVPVKTSTWYALVNQHSGKALEVYNGATTDGARVAQWSRNDGPWQQWRLLDAGNGYYKLVNKNSGKVLDVPAFSTDEGKVLDQWSDANGTNVQFHLKASAAGTVRLINRHSGKAASVGGSSTTDGADVVQSTDSDGANQRWKLVPVDTPHQVTVDTNAWYMLINRHSGKAMEVFDKATTDGARVAQWTRNNGAWQQWKFVDSGNGYYRLRNRFSGKVLNVPAFSTADGTRLNQWSDTNGANVQFRLAESPGGMVRLINRHSGKAVETHDWSSADGADVAHWTDLNGANQQWMLLPVDTDSQTTVNTGLWYVLRNRNSGKVLDDHEWKTVNGSRVVQFTRNEEAVQQWQFVASGDGYHRLRNRHSNRVLDVRDWSTADGANIEQWEDRDYPNQRFQVVPTDSGYVKLVNKNSGKVVDVPQSSTADGTGIVQFSYHGGNNQQWQLIPVGPAAYPAPEPVTGGTATHDPTVIKLSNGKYLLAGTAMGLMTSDDRVNWTPAGEVFPNGSPSWTDSYTDPASHMLWAPDISYRIGKYYMYYSASNAGSNKSAIGLATSTTGTSGWVDQGKVLESTASGDFNAIDPNLIVDHTGRWWLSFGSYWSGLKLVEIDPATGKRKDAIIHSIASRSHAPGNDHRVEAPYIVKRGDYFYLYVSFDACCADRLAATYRVMVGRSTSVTGPYVDKNGHPMTHGGGTEILAGHGAVHGPGHQAVLTGDTDGDILFYHYYADNKDGGSGCHYCKFGINHIGYDSQGWPFIY